MRVACRATELEQQRTARSSFADSVVQSLQMNVPSREGCNYQPVFLLRRLQVTSVFAKQFGVSVQHTAFTNPPVTND